MNRIFIPLYVTDVDRKSFKWKTKMFSSCKLIYVIMDVMLLYKWVKVPKYDIMKVYMKSAEEGLLSVWKRALLIEDEYLLLK